MSEIAKLHEKIKQLEHDLNVTKEFAAYILDGIIYEDFPISDFDTFADQARDMWPARMKKIKEMVTNF